MREQRQKLRNSGMFQPAAEDERNAAIATLAGLIQRIAQSAKQD